MKEICFVTSSIGQISYLLWRHIYPEDVTFSPEVACLYFDDKQNWGELMNSYWMGEKLPTCEIAECIVVAQRIIKKGEIDRKWFKEMKSAIKDIQEDYIFPVI